MAAATGLSPSSIVRIWRAVGLEPDRSGSFSLTGDPLQIDNACDIAGLYLSAAGNAIVVCIDKRSHVGPLDLSRPPVFPLRAAVPERRIHDNTSGDLISLFFELRTASAKIPRPREVQQQHALLAVLDKIDSDVSSRLEPIRYSMTTHPIRCQPSNAGSHNIRDSVCTPHRPVLAGVIKSRVFSLG